MIECPFCEKALSVGPRPGVEEAVVPCTRCLNPVAVSFAKGKEFAVALGSAADIRGECPEGSLGGLALGALQNSTYELPMHAPVSGWLRKRTARDVDTLRALATTDVVSAAALLQEANSSAFGGLQPIGTIDGALDRVGPDRARAILDALADRRVLAPEIAALADAAKRTWENSAFSGRCCQEIGRKTSDPRADVYLVAGLLHNIGTSVLIDLLSADQAPVAQATSQSEKLLEEVFNRFSPLAALHLSSRWRLPLEITNAVFAWPSPEMLNDAGLAYHAHIVCLADSIARATGYGEKRDSDVTLLAHRSNRLVGLSDVRISALRVDLSDELSNTIRKFGMAPLPPPAAITKF